MNYIMIDRVELTLLFYLFAQIFFSSIDLIGVISLAVPTKKASLALLIAA